MSIANRLPTFGGKLKTDDYYANINAILRVLRPYSTLRTCASHLNAQGFTTPTGREWTRERVSTYLKGNNINSNTN